MCRTTSANKRKKPKKQFRREANRTDARVVAVFARPGNIAAAEKRALAIFEMPQHIAHITLVVRDYDEAIAFFTQVLNFELIEDTPSKDRQGRDKRWVLIAPPGSRGTQILLAKASNEQESSRIGNQTGGRVFLFLHTDDFKRDYEAMKAKGVKFIRDPKEEEYGTVAVFEDLYGNRWDLLEPRFLAE